MDHMLKQDTNGKNSIYSGAGNFIVVTNVNAQGYAPGPAFILVKKEEFAKILKLVEETKLSGTKRSTAQGKVAIDYANDEYAVAVVAIDNGTLIEVTMKTGELSGMSLRWIVDLQGNVAFKCNDKFYWFSPSGATSFDFGFKRITAQVGEQKYDQTQRGYVTEYGKPSYLTIPNSPTVEAFEKAYKGMKIFSAIISYAQSKLAPAGVNFDDVPDFGGTDGFTAVN